MSVLRLRKPLRFLVRTLRDNRIFYWRKELIFRLSTADGHEGKPILSNARTRRATLSDIDELAKNRENSYREGITRRLSRGDICFLLERDGEVLSFLWASPEKMHINEVNFTFVCPSVEKSLAVYDVFTYPEYRRKGAYRSLFQGFLEYAMSGSYQNVYLSIAMENRISRKVHERLGFKKTSMELTRLIFFGKDWTFVSKEE